MKVIAENIHFSNADGASKGKGLGNFFKDSDNMAAVTTLAAKGKDLLGGIQQNRNARKDAEAAQRLAAQESADKAKSKRTVLIVGGIVAGVALLSIGIYFAVRKKK